MSARHPVLQELLRSVPPPRTAPPAPDQRAAKRRGTQRAAPRRASKRKKPRATKKCTYALPRELAQELQVLCAVQDVTQRAVIEQLVREYVGRHQKLLPD